MNIDSWIWFTGVISDDFMYSIDIGLKSFIYTLCVTLVFNCYIG